jgi:hypothetical protein
MSEHSPAAGHWICLGCDEPAAWPSGCSFAQRHLLGLYGGPTESLRRYLEDCLVSACRDRPSMSAGGLWRQFLGWFEAERQRRAAYATNDGSHWPRRRTFIA